MEKTSPPRFYSARRREDLPYALSGLVLSLSLVFHLTNPLLTLILIGFILVSRSYARLTWIENHGRIWIIKLPFRQQMGIADKDIVRFDVFRRFFRTYLSIYYHDGESLCSCLVPSPPFDLALFLLDAREYNPEQVGKQAIRYLESRKKVERSRRDIITGTVAFVGMVLCSITAFSLLSARPGHEIVINLFPFNLWSLTYPPNWSLILIIPLLLRLKQTYRANNSLSAGSLIVALALYVLYAPFARYTSELHNPGALAGGTSGLAMAYCMICLRSFFFPGRLGSAVAVIIGALAVIAGPQVLYQGQPALTAAFGEFEGRLLDMGWKSGKEPFYWTVEKKGSIYCRTYSPDGGKIAELEFVQDVSISWSRDYRVRKLIRPITPERWIVGEHRRILLREPGRDIPDTIWTSADLTGRDGSAEDYIPRLFLSPDDKQVAWTTTAGRFFVCSIESLSTGEITFPGIMEQNTENLFPEILGWQDSGHLLVQVETYQADNVEIADMRFLFQLDLATRRAVLLDSSGIAWRLMSQHENGIRLWGTGGGSEDFGIYTFEPGRPPARIDIPFTSRQFQLSAACPLSEDTWLLVFALGSKFDDSESEPVIELFTWNPDTVQHAGSIPAEYLIEAASDGRAATLIVRNGLLNDWWRIEPGRDGWTAGQIGRIQGIYNALNGKSATNGTLFSPDGISFIWQYRSPSWLNPRVDQAFAVWELR